ncbi:hypothetical protein, partial [Fusobacterium necrophorum]|uniref:hypothetical protein n=1 Tax=Fusobacterium necrophorum TaxID=859 RepID=UPI001C9C5CB4
KKQRNKETKKRAREWRPWERAILKNLASETDKDGQHTLAQVPILQRKHTHSHTHTHTETGEIRFTLNIFLIMKQRD